MINLVIKSNRVKLQSKEQRNSKIRVDIDLLNNQEKIEISKIHRQKKQHHSTHNSGKPPTSAHRMASSKNPKRKGRADPMKQPSEMMSSHRMQMDTIKRWSYQPPTLSSPKGSQLLRSKNDSADIEHLSREKSDQDRPLMNQIQASIRVSGEKRRTQEEIENLISQQEMSQRRITEEYAKHFQLLESSASSASAVKIQTYEEKPSQSKGIQARQSVEEFEQKVDGSYTPPDEGHVGRNNFFNHAFEDSVKRIRTKVSGTSVSHLKREGSDEKRNFQTQSNYNESNNSEAAQPNIGVIIVDKEAYLTQQQNVNRTEKSAIMESQDADFPQHQYSIKQPQATSQFYPESSCMNSVSKPAKKGTESALQVDEIEDIRQSDTVKTEYLVNNASTQRGLPNTNISTKAPLEEPKKKSKIQFTKAQLAQQMSPSGYQTNEFELDVYSEQQKMNEGLPHQSKSNQLPTRLHHLTQEQFSANQAIGSNESATIKILTNNQSNLLNGNYTPNLVLHGQTFQSQAANSNPRLSASLINQDLPTSNNQSQLVQIINQNPIYRQASSAEGKSTGIDFTNLDFADLLRIDKEIRMAKQRQDRVDKFDLLSKANIWAKKDNVYLDKSQCADSQGNRLPSFEELQYKSELGYLIDQRNKQIRKEQKRKTSKEFTEQTAVIPTSGDSAKKPTNLKVVSNSLDCKMSTLQKSFDQRVSLERKEGIRIKEQIQNKSPPSNGQSKNESKQEGTVTSMTQQNKTSPNHNMHSQVSFNNQNSERAKNPLVQSSKSLQGLSKILQTTGGEGSKMQTDQSRCFSNMDNRKKGPDQVLYKEIQAKQLHLDIGDNQNGNFVFSKGSPRNTMTNRSHFKRSEQHTNAPSTQRSHKPTNAVVVLPQINSTSQGFPTGATSKMLGASSNVQCFNQEEDGTKSKTAQNSPRFMAQKVTTDGQPDPSQPKHLRSVSSSAMMSVTVDSKTADNRMHAKGLMSEEATSLSNIHSQFAQPAPNRRLSQSTRKIQAILRETYLNPNMKSQVRREKMTLNQKMHLMKNIEAEYKRSQGYIRGRLSKDRQVMLNRDMLFDQQLAENTKINERQKLVNHHPHSLERLANMHRPTLEDEIIRFINFDDKQRSLIIKDLREMHLCSLKPSQTHRLFTHRSYNRPQIMNSPTRAMLQTMGNSRSRRKKARSHERALKEIKSLSSFPRQAAATFEEPQCKIVKSQVRADNTAAVNQNPVNGSFENERVLVKTLIIEDSESAPLDGPPEEENIRTNHSGYLDASKLRQDIKQNLMEKSPNPLSISTPQFTAHNNQVLFDRNQPLLQSYNIKSHDVPPNQPANSTLQSHNSAVLIQNNNLSSGTSNNATSHRHEMNFNSSSNQNVNKGTLLASSYEMSPLQKGGRREVTHSRKNFDLSLDHSPFSTQFRFNENQGLMPQTQAPTTQLKDGIVSEDDENRESKSVADLQTQVIMHHQLPSLPMEATDLQKNRNLSGKSKSKGGRRLKSKSHMLQHQLNHSRKIISSQEANLESLNSENIIKIVDINKVSSPAFPLDQGLSQVFSNINPQPNFEPFNPDAKYFSQILDEPLEEETVDENISGGPFSLTDRFKSDQVRTADETNKKKEGLFQGDFHRHIGRRLKDLKLDFNTYGVKDPFNIDLRDRQFQRQLKMENLNIKPNYELQPKHLREEAPKFQDKEIPTQNFKFQSQKRLSPFHNRIESPKYQRPTPTRSMLSAKRHRMSGRYTGQAIQEPPELIVENNPAKPKTPCEPVVDLKAQKKAQREQRHKLYEERMEEFRAKEMLVEDIKQQIQRDINKGTLHEMSHDLFKSMTHPSSTQHMSQLSSVTNVVAPSSFSATNKGRNSLLFSGQRDDVKQIQCSTGHIRATIQSRKKLTSEDSYRVEIQSTRQADHQKVEIPNLDLASLGVGLPAQMVPSSSRALMRPPAKVTGPSLLQKKLLEREALNEQEYDLFGDFIDSNLGISRKYSKIKAEAQTTAIIDDSLTSVAGLKVKSQKIELKTQKAEERTKGFTGNKKRLLHTRQVQKMKGHPYRRKKDPVSQFGQTVLPTQPSVGNNSVGGHTHGNMIVIPNLDLQNRNFNFDKGGSLVEKQGTLPCGTIESGGQAEMSNRKFINESVKSQMTKGQMMIYDDQSSLLNQKSPMNSVEGQPVPDGRLRAEFSISSEQKEPANSQRNVLIMDQQEKSKRREGDGLHSASQEV